MQTGGSLSPDMILLTNSFLTPDVAPDMPQSVVGGGPVAYPLLARKHATKFMALKKAHQEEGRLKRHRDGIAAEYSYHVFGPITKASKVTAELFQDFDELDTEDYTKAIHQDA